MSKYCVSDERVAVNHSTALGAPSVVSAFAAAAQANSERLLSTGGVHTAVRSSVARHGALQGSF
jgi:hypothetical protein